MQPFSAVHPEMQGVTVRGLTLAADNCHMYCFLFSIILITTRTTPFAETAFHVQVHRRSRRLKRLADHCDEGHIRNPTINDIFIPLVGNFISTGTVQQLIDAAIVTTGRMTRRLVWPAYHALVRKYLGLAESKDESERIYVRTLVS